MALVVSFRAASESFMEHTKERRHARYRGTIANIEGAREGSASDGSGSALNDQDFPYKSIVRNWKEIIRVADEAG
jgi:hypothetical protein